MSKAKILDKINSFDQWHYQFDLDGYLTPIFKTININRHQQRKNYFFQPLINLFGGSLAGKRVLDLGCNAGFWSLCAIESGCDYVLGIDARQMHIDQAEFVFDVKKVDRTRYNFYCGNIFNLLTNDLGSFDIVLFLGLMYHINKPITLLEKISAINTDVLVIDTVISKQRGSIIELRHENLTDPRNAIDYELVMIPSRTAVLDMTHQFGYQSSVLKVNFSNYEGAQDYNNGRRRAFICAKNTQLVSLEAESIDDLNATPLKPGGAE